MMDTLLVIEDDPETRELIVEELSEAGFTVKTAGDGAAGLQAMLDFQPDLVICDISKIGRAHV